MVRIASFNVNGLRAVKDKGKDGAKGCSFDANVLCRLALEQRLDILCLQEIKTTDTVEIDLIPYQSIFPYIYTNTSKTKRGYSGVAILSKVKPLRVSADFTLFSCDEIGGDAAAYEFSREGRVLIAEFAGFWLLNTYTPNSKTGLTRLKERLVWDEYYRDAIRLLEVGSDTSVHESASAGAGAGASPSPVHPPIRSTKPVVAVGDLNVAHCEIDLCNPETSHKLPGFSKEERASFTNILEEAELVDTFRHLHPTKVKYSFWSAMSRARARNAGWRIDYVLVSECLRPAIVAADILTEYHGSDHCPVLAELDIAA
jgi:exodeoxyribonuclease-3